MARKGLPGKYIRQAAKSGNKKTMMKRAWALYRKSKRSSGTATKKKTSGGSTKRKPQTRAGTTMKKKATKRKAVSKKMKGSPRRKLSLMSNRTINALANGAVIGLSALAGLFIVNKTPWVKEQKPWMKAAFEAGVGVVGLMFIRQPMGKKAATGLIAGAAITMAIPFMPEGLQFAPMLETSGGARPFTPRELADVQSMGIPANIMGKPVDIGYVATMGRGGTRRRVRARF